MRICRSIPETRVALAGAPRPVGFVATMGALHAGHAALVERCREECATVAASVFVNPTQFGPKEDLDRYPRDLEGDAGLLESLGTDLLFAPEAGELYPEGFSTSIEVGPLGTVFEGASRPGHFSGVATVVAKLFHIVLPDRAYFGRKDAQQLAVIRKMVRDLDLDCSIEVVETVRDPDGLALSSRNVYLDAAQRKRALGLARGLRRGAQAWARGERDPITLAKIAREPGLDYDYLACVDPDSFRAPGPDGPALLVAAARVGTTRLIDNVVLPATIKGCGP